METWTQNKGREQGHGSHPAFQREVDPKGPTDAANANGTLQMPTGEKEDAARSHFQD